MKNKLFGLCAVVALLLTVQAAYGAGSIVATPDAPKAIGPYSQAIVHGNMAFLAGQIAIDPKTGKLSKGGIEEQTRLVCKNIKAVLKACGMTFKDVLKSTCYLKNMDDFKKFNAVYGEYFGDHPPARGTVEVARLPKDVLVEIAVIAGR